MLILLSPAKTLDFETDNSSVATTEPELLAESKTLVAKLKKLSPQQLSELMGISEKLAELNFERFQSWKNPMPADETQPAIFAFQGDVYQGLEADKLTKKQIEYAQDHLRILSGLYGVLRPLDRMLAYRLEMGTALTTRRGKDLYAFWGSRITSLVRDQIEATGSRAVLNLASNEYFKSVQADRLGVPVVSPSFKENKDGKYKMISFFAKKARGTFAAWAIRTKAKTPTKLEKFAEDGYRYDPESSTDTVPVFLRG